MVTSTAFMLFSEGSTISSLRAPPEPALGGAPPAAADGAAALADGVDPPDLQPNKVNAITAPANSFLVINMSYS
jgi:hypothetical protein